MAPQEETKVPGRVDISPEVIQLISGLAATEVEGVAGLKGGVVGDLNQWLGRKNLRQGVKVELGDKIEIDVAIIVHYGEQVVEVGQLVQSQVKERVEEMTGLPIDRIVVRIAGLKFPQTEETQESTPVQRVR
ncbi:Uncharacterized conserved protein YloU, alkaline shock protein (Asp23) family [Seinonella peptonophila]|uniref:Uncharacterized conserved protein YloU, alkaline shock protein (Asp23) family n=1 Tax=Seinonella peptonophila TaxID=112248 RepID=A0A1M4TME1_9BACL|nr:Asp23/Gls24 family envelope stress response protein [Seinonella peptonophila]SHE45630.1 Uncharacterized conserved protein YloU, alkaline shock protein (Asp23) family [Seinonella peptonophila]